MDASLQDRLTAANKLVFIKKYAEALVIIDDLLCLAQGKNELLLHLRKIELICSLPDHDALVEQYRASLQERTISEETRDSALALLDLWSEHLPLEQSVQTLQELHGRIPHSAAAVFGLGLCYELEDNSELALQHYRQSLQYNPEWYPAYFHLSQLYFQLNDKEQGEHFFQLFERFSPYYLHGNFATHKHLCDELLAQNAYADAETAITTLADWWLAQKGRCPVEVKIYEALVLAKISLLMERPAPHQQHFQRALDESNRLLDGSSIDANALFFVVNIFDDYSDNPEVFSLLKKIVRRAGNDSALLKAVASKLFAHGKIADAVALFEEAYAIFPDNEEVRFCRLLAAIKSQGVAVDKYFAAKEHYTNLKNSEVSKSELLVKLHGLNALYDRDPDVHLAIANLYRYLGNQERAADHYRLMLKYDHLGRKTQLKYAASLVASREFERIIALLDQLRFDGEREQEHFLEHKWLLTICYFEQQRYHEAQPLLSTLVAIDPWNARYLTYLIMTYTYLNTPQLTASNEQNLLDLAGIEEREPNWASFRQITRYFSRNDHHEIAYLRSKLDFLYHSDDDEVAEQLIACALSYNATQATADLLKILNSNFDRPAIMLGLARLAQEQWQLETATMWYEQLLRRDFTPVAIKQVAYAELADCYLWRNRDLEKAQQYILLAQELVQPALENHAFIQMHLFLRQGKLHEARFLLEKTPARSDHFELTYLWGLLWFKSGLLAKAKSVWKPLIKQRCDNLRAYHLKKDMLDLYFA